MRPKQFSWSIIVLIGVIYFGSSVALELPVGAVAPSQDQLTRLLSGNTLDGVWAGKPFRQFFEASGATRYQDGNGPTTTGTWRVSSDGRYCSVWPPSSRETCYQVLVAGEQIFWSTGERYYPSRVIEGNTFD